MFDSDILLFGYLLHIPAYGKQLLLAALIGFVFGIERLIRGKVATLRTFSMICMSICCRTS